MKKLMVTLLLCAIVLFGAAFGFQAIGNARVQADHLYIMQTLLPGAESFTVEPYSGEDANILSVHKAQQGFVIETQTRGYADHIRMLIGVSKDGKVTGLVVLEAHETFGLGSMILTDHAFLAQFLNGDSSFTIGSADSFSSATGEAESTGTETAVDGISGATVSSKAVVRCVNSAIAYVTGADIDSGATSWGG